jgi:PAS domain S-box-containing protein
MGGDDDTLRRAIFEHAQDAMLLIDDASIVLDANAAAVELFGRSRAELVGATSYVFAVEADRAACEAWLTERREGRAAWEGAFRGEMRIERPDGSIRLSEYVLSGGIAPGRHLVVHRDVTERRAREGEAERYRVLWQRARDICLFIGRGGRLLDANDAAIEAYGYSRDELLAPTSSARWRRRSPPARSSRPSTCARTARGCRSRSAPARRRSAASGSC